MTSHPVRSTFAAMTFLLVAIVTDCALASQNPGAVFLMIWPSTRATSLAGAMTGLADDADAAYWNPGGLGFQRSLGVTGTAASWLPGLYPGMYFLYGSGGYGFSLIPDLLDANIGGNITYLTTGETDVINEHGEFLGRYTSWDGAFALHGGIALFDKVGIGANVKYIYSYLVPDWVWEVMPELGIEAGGTGVSVAADVGVLYRPFAMLGIGLSVANLGPNISYTSSGESDPLPRMLRLGFCLTPWDDPLLRLRVLPELNKVLVGMFYDPEGTRSPGQLLGTEWRDTWKSLGFEATVLQILSIRVGYFEDITGQRGGLVLERDGVTNHFGLFERIPNPREYTLKGIGICWGVGLGLRDYFRIDLASDAAIYDFPTQNWKLGLSVNNLRGLVEDLEKGKLFGWTLWIGVRVRLQCPLGRPSTRALETSAHAPLCRGSAPAIHRTRRTWPRLCPSGNRDALLASCLLLQGHLTSMLVIGVTGVRRAAR